MTDKDLIGLALSGGGYRATLFHLGALWRLNELSLLPTIDRISAVSGGALLAGLVATRWSRLNFNKDTATNFQDEIVDPIWDFCSLGIDLKTIFYGLFRNAKVLERHYRKHLVGESNLQDTPDRPEFVFNAAHIETGRNWTFSKTCMRTYRLGRIDHPHIKLSKVLAASSALPPFLPPVTLKLDPEEFQRDKYDDLFERADLKRKVSLIDGGVYDNLGIQSIRDFKTLLISEASSPLKPTRGNPLSRLYFQRVKRPIDIAIEQTRTLRRTSILNQLQNGDKKGALWMNTTDIEQYPLQSTFPVQKEWSSAIGAIRTRLIPFTDEEKSRIINWGYLLADLSLRGYYCKNAPPPRSLPFPKFGFEDLPENRNPKS